MKKIIITEKQFDKLMCESIDNVYFDSFSRAVQTAREEVEKRGYIIDEDDWWNEVSVGPGRPKDGETRRMSIGLWKNDKLSKKGLHIQVYNRGIKFKYNYELNFYVL